MQATLAYVTQDLIYMYLKTKGIDPSGHPVMAQMTEISKYFAKIKDTEDPEKRKLAVDRDAARRFINAALRGALPVPRVNGSELPDTLAPESIETGVQAHMKITAKQIERKRLAEEEDSPSEDDGIDFFDEALGSQGGRDSISRDSFSENIKTRRPPMDPFAGYDSKKFNA